VLRGAAAGLSAVALLQRFLGSFSVEDAVVKRSIESEKQRQNQRERERWGERDQAKEIYWSKASA
jgi:hypothetical protein